MSEVLRACEDMDAHKEGLIEAHMSACVRLGGIVSCKPDSVWMGYPSTIDDIVRVGLPQDCVEGAFILLYCSGDVRALADGCEELLAYGYTHLYSVKGWRGQKNWKLYDLKRFARLMKQLYKDHE